MPLSFNSADDFKWSVKKIAVIGPGIVGMPMAALLASARIREGSETPARVVVLQRNSGTSGWKVPAINAGKSVIGGVEPSLDAIVRETVAEGILSASHEYDAASDADMVLVCVQTDKKGLAPDYGPMFEALEGLALALRKKPAGNIPVIVFESTLAPSSMATLMKDHFARHGLVEGKNILLGNSPNRVMPGRLVERVAEADKLVAGLDPLTPKLIKRIYSRIVTRGELHETNSLTAEMVKTLENAYRDVRIAFAAEIARYCDARDIDFFAVRDEVNRKLAQTDEASTDPTAVPSGAMLVPTVGVGGHCLAQGWHPSLVAEDRVRRRYEPSAHPRIAKDQRRVPRRNDEAGRTAFRQPCRKENRSAWRGISIRFGRHPEFPYPLSREAPAGQGLHGHDP